ncbi:XRE family transcriptional regulator [Enterococcus faecium]|uniref:helix-turn-helix domain-containing protein n=1 Tax=Enterococcus faecium TaxID=1352 RepID=UPI000CF07800|nr:helix-turn-helix transcriptional regulator [Enterococcus faecium]EGP5619478.1 helix-turn-helix transcriptional regulator [Enterococcus faecium]PQB69802.1 XRE family transcriptional regulator [Enterococcus faecium]PQC35668.1 XRE family transcriptional regulator [Enterococcus faecium]
MTLKQQVLIALVKKDWSQRELARRMGISITYLRDIFIEKRKPKERLKQIEELLDIKLEVDSNDQSSEQEA